MIRTFFTLLLLALLSSTNFVFGQKEIVLSGKLNACQEDSLRLFVLDGVSLRQVAVMPIQEQEGVKVFSVRINQVPMGIYFLGLGQKDNTLQLILGS
ncbi:MAG: hypothetical protein AAF696_38315, partial [Bacteroidota bacterium]